MQLRKLYGNKELAPAVFNARVIPSVVYTDRRSPGLA